MTDNEDADFNEKIIKIFVRVFPFDRSSEFCGKIDRERKKIYVRCLQEMQSNRIALSKEASYWCFQVDDIFEEDSSQEEIYRVSTEDLVPKILAGVNCVLMGYGQTGSGKSFTVSGLTNNWEHRGLIARLISDMFAEKARKKKCNRIRYCVSYVELHGKEAKDLLASTGNNIRINDRDPFKNISVVTVKNAEEALGKIFEGEVRRASVKGSTYPVSHLATGVVTFHVSNVSLITSWATVTTAKMHIVEVAGTGTVGKNNCWKAAADVGIANLTKTQLEQFFSYLASERTSSAGGGGTPLIRSSNLLKILGDAFSFSSIIRLVSHVRMKKEDLNMTLSTLKFTAKIAGLKAARVRGNVAYRPDFLLHRLRNEVDALKKELTINELLLHQEPLTNISESRVEQINRSVVDYLNGKISDFTLFTLSQARVLLKSIKDLYNRLTTTTTTTTKELEVETLKETYENLARSIAEINNTLSAASSPNKSVQESEQSTTETDKQVGSLNDSGVTLGPYSGERIEEEEEEEEEGTMNGKERLETKKYSVNDEIHKIHISKVRQMFERFLKEKREYARIKEQLSAIERSLTAFRHRFSDTTEKYFQAKRNLENVRNKLSEHQRIRYIMEGEICNGGKSKVVPKIEKTIQRDVLCYEKVLANLEEEVRREEEHMDKLVEKQAELCSKLDYGFREYCKTMDLLLCHNDRPMKMLLAPVDQESLEMIRRKFNKYQRAMFRKIEDTTRTKNKVQFNYHRMIVADQL